MLENYKETQKVAYKILTNAIKNNKCSHAYLFETGNYTESENFIMSFVKSLLCPHHYTKNENCEECNICKQIDDGNFTELKIIKPDGMQIKKEKLLELQEEFTKKAITGNKKVYIIENAEKLNKSSANSILKFLRTCLQIAPTATLDAVSLAEDLSKTFLASSKSYFKQPTKSA